MDANEFVIGIKQSVIDRVFVYYETTLESSPSATDPVWKGILPLYKVLANEEKAVFLQLVRLVQVNTVSHMLGILDGSSYLNDKPESSFLQLKQKKGLLTGICRICFLRWKKKNNWCNKIPVCR